MEEDAKTNPTQKSESSQELVIIFELVTEEGENDPALINAVGRELVAAMQQEGYVARPPVYTGQKGVESFLVELVATAQQITTTVWDNHAAIAEGIADLSGLITTFGGILPMLKRMRQIHEKQMSKEESTARPIKMTAEIDGAPLVIEAPDIFQADAALKLALKYRSAYPDSVHQVTSKSKVKVKGRIPARKQRPRR